MVDLEGDAQVRRGNKVENRTGRGSGRRRRKERIQSNLNIKEKKLRLQVMHHSVLPSVCFK